MDDEGNSGNVIDMRSRMTYKPDMGALARDQFASVRRTTDYSREEFATALSQLLGWDVTAEHVKSWELSATPPGDALVAAGVIAKAGPIDIADSRASDLVTQLTGNRFADVTAVYSSRSEFTSNLPPHALFDNALRIRAAGLSLNLIVQQIASNDLTRLVAQGTTVQCLFLDPAGTCIKMREEEERYAGGELQSLTALNINSLSSRVRDRLDPEARGRLQIATYDETIRFNVTLVDKPDDHLCVFQPYLPESRGVDSPTFVANKRWPNAGLYPTFETVFDSIWERSTPV